MSEKNGSHPTQPPQSIVEGDDYVTMLESVQQNLSSAAASIGGAAEKIERSIDIYMKWKVSRGRDTSPNQAFRDLSALKWDEIRELIKLTEAEINRQLPALRALSAFEKKLRDMLHTGE